MLYGDDETLLADESFVNFCLGRNAHDVHRWEKMMEDNPGEITRIEELKMMVLLTGRNIHEIELKNQIALLDQRIELAEHQNEPVRSVPSQRIITGWKMIAAAACILFIAGTGYYYLSADNSKQLSAQQTYSTKIAEKKSLLLPDGSTVILNAQSHISLSADFGKVDRKVILDGEAFFDVVHNTGKPFIVQTQRMDVKVLGTAFNVKAYNTDAVYETSLIRGSVELSLKNERKTITLRPHEKYVLRDADKDNPAIAVNENMAEATSVKAEGLLPVSIYKKDTSIAEVSWTENKLVFVDEPFDEVVKKLERWYGITIDITDPLVAKNLYTAAFRNEDLENVLSALQFSKPFTFKKENNAIIISK